MYSPKAKKLINHMIANISTTLEQGIDSKNTTWTPKYKYHRFTGAWLPPTHYGQFNLMFSRNSLQDIQIQCAICSQ